MAEIITADSYPEEYSRPPVYLRPYGGIVRMLEKVFKDGKTFTEATPPTPTTES